MSSFENDAVKKEISSKNTESVPVLKNSQYFEKEYLTEFPIGNVYVDNYGQVPSSICINDSLNLTVVDSIIGMGFLLVRATQVSHKKHKYPVSHLYKRDDNFIFLKFKKERKITNGYSSFTVSMDEYEDTDFGSDEPSKIDAVIYYSDYEQSEIIHNELIKHTITGLSKSRISLLVSNMRGLSTSPQNIRSNESLDIELNYGKDFVPVHNKILQKLNEEGGKGLVLLHGIPGTGKTSYIRYLCYKLKKEVIFLPPNLAENISSPDFVSLLLEHTNSVLIIEDAEKIVFDRESGGSSRQGVSSILNMTDGILGDCLSIQIIATFNTSRDKIDKALLRKGRLIAEWKFGELSVDDSNKLLSSLSKGHTTKVPMTLTDIYNFDEEVNVVQEERRSIGFSKH